ncbi:aspartate 1-decarboxylase [Caldithrix abyssi]|uniref:Aspartate 1-decarboxylase n=1 Tax=Caldithrix abyssi DSM 13497 TaxID=880073 RepID=H1XRD6_CALAY|nr:aspartate 1-decarboxylase [Caldithrix abyssi]APF18410.1 panD L-aspartate 1-decarboxylase [Caldithrix abyssi DSM 13497]EHO42417.1 Aspartate 1-decarboxylase [Caldithrix abyssi DSM 13497]
MERIFFKSKIHRATVTDADLNYEGSLSIDPDLMAAADILPYEKVDVVNITTGDRFTTYAIKGKPGSGEIGLNGGAARKGHVGDLVIIITYANVPEEEIEKHRVKVVLVDEQNRIKSVHEDTIK